MSSGLKWIFTWGVRQTPSLIIENIPKASEYFQYICCDNWDSDLENLFNTLNVALNLRIEEKIKSIILSESKNSPRILKNIFRKTIALNSIDTDSINKIIKTTIQESC